MIDILSDIEQFNQYLTISKVITLFERKGIKITKSMIQNYVRNGILSPPVRNRYYTPKHLTVLVMVDKLKTAYELSYIKNVLQPLTDGEGIPLDVYRQYVKASETLNFPQTDDVLLLMLYSTDIQSEAVRRLVNEAIDFI